MQNDYGFTLGFSDGDSEILLPIITELQQKYCNKPPFEPHLTIHTAVKTNLDKDIKVVDEISVGFKPFVVKSDGFGFQNKWSKILYIKIIPSLQLIELHNNIGIKLNALGPRVYIPHISLMYKDELSNEEREKIISKLNIPNLFTINSIEVISSGTDSEDWSDNTKWKVEYRRNL